MRNATATITVRPGAQAMVDQINEEFAAGNLHTVNGRKLKDRYGQQVATLWQNGTVSFTVEGRKPHTTGEVFVKVGQSFELA